MVRELPQKARTTFGELIGIDPDLDFDVSEMRRSMRIGPDGQHKPQIIVSLTQSRPMKLDGRDYTFPGGSTLLVELTSGKIQYTIGKRINSDSQIDGKTREERTAAFLTEASRDPLQELLLTPKAEPFAALHSFTDVVS